MFGVDGRNEKCNCKSNNNARYVCINICGKSYNKY